VKASVMKREKENKEESLISKFIFLFSCGNKNYKI